jgi:hypothetical protein
MSVSAQHNHATFMDEGGVTVSRARFLSYDLTLFLIIDDLWKVDLTLLIARLLTHGGETEQKCLRSGRMASLLFGFIKSAFDVAQ